MGFWLKTMQQNPGLGISGGVLNAKTFLVGGATHLKKYESNWNSWIISPNRDEHQKKNETAI